MNSLTAPRRWRQRLFVGLGLIAGLLVSAWLTFPYWAHLLFSAALPSGWQIVELDTGRPGIRTLPIEEIRVQGALPGFQLNLEAGDISARLDGTALRISRLSVRLEPATRKVSAFQEDDQTFLDRWSLPRLVPPGGLPRIEIQRLEWSLGEGDKVQSGMLENLEFGQDATSATLVTSLKPIPYLNRPGRLTTQLSEDGLFLDLFTDDAESTRVFFYRQAAVGGTGVDEKDAIATLQLELNLAELDRVAFEPFVTPPDRTEGVLSAAIQFKGSERLRPVAFNLKADKLEIASGTDSLQLDGSLNGGLDGQTILVDQEILKAKVAIGPDRWEVLTQAAESRFGLSGLPRGLAQLAVIANRPSRAQFDARSGLPTSWEGDLALEAEAAGSRAALRLTNARLDLDAENSFEFDAGLEVSLDHRQALRLHQPGLGIALDTLQLALEADVKYGPSGVQASGGTFERFLGTGLQITLEDQELRASQVRASGEFAWGARSHFKGPLQGSDLVVSEAGSILPMLKSASVSGSIEASLDGNSSAKGQLRFDGVSLPVMDVPMDALDVTIEELDPATLDGHLSLLTTGMRVPLFDKKATGIDLDLASEIKDGGPWRGSGELLIGYSASLPFTFRTSDQGGHLVIDLDRAPLATNALPTLLRALEPAWAEPFKPGVGALVLHGSVDLLEIDGEIVPTGELAIDTDGLGFCFGESCLSDLDLHGTWKLGANISGATSLSIGQAGLAAGLDLLEFTTSIEVDSIHTIRLNDLSAGLLGGLLQSSPILIENQGLANTTLSWTGFELARLFAFLDVAGLDGSGRIDAELPIVNMNGHLGITDGRFKAEGPGTIRYQTGAPAANIGMQALENFNFESLEGTADYNPDGRYDIQITLDGRNPDLYGGHPVRFNLNIGGELPALFKTLFITGDFGEAILDQVRSGNEAIQNPGS